MMHSPSSINTYCNCPRKYWYIYINGEKMKESLPLIKGSAVHSILDRFFEPKYYKKNIKDNLNALLNKELAYRQQRHKLSEEDIVVMKGELKFIVNLFLSRVEQLLDSVMLDGKINSKSHAWNLIRPKFREVKLVNDELGLQGIIDSIEETFDGKIIITDYKTSKLYGNKISEDYARQLALYALLYFKEHGTLPDYTAINYLRYGTVFLIPTNYATLEKAENVLKEVQCNTTEKEMDKYPIKKHKLCDWCDFKDRCFSNESK